jgi:hypothetical protein
MHSKLTRIALALLIAVLPLAAQAGRGTAQATIKGKKLTISYGKPKLQGRDMIGMARPGMTWRLGMDDATEIETTGTLVVGTKELKPGKYTLWAKKVSATDWTLNFHTTTGVWGDPALETGYAATLPLKLDKAATSAEELVISLADRNGDAAVTIRWGTAQLTGAFGVK